MININVLLFDPQKTNIGMIGDIGHRDPGHEPAEISQYQQEEGVQYIGAADYLFYF